MNTLIRNRSLVFALIFIAPLLVSLPGCSEEKAVSTTSPSEELKKSEDSYNSVIAKQKADTKTAK